MRQKLSILPEAETELLAAAQWYEQRRAGLGVELIATVDVALHEILDDQRQLYLPVRTIRIAGLRELGAHETLDHWRSNGHRCASPTAEAKDDRRKDARGRKSFVSPYYALVQCLGTRARDSGSGESVLTAYLIDFPMLGGNKVMVEILTKRLALKPLVAADATALFAYRSDAAVSKYQSWEPGSLEEANSYIARYDTLEFDVSGTWFQLGVRDRALGSLVGDLGVHFLADVPRQVEIGITVAPSQQGRGFATEAVVGLISHLFTVAQKHRVFASVDPTNAPSMALFRRAGMRQEAHFHKSLWWKDQWVDDVIFGVLASEWAARQ